MGLVSSASACGGFFCSGGAYTTVTQQTTFEYVVPVAQSAERILFRVNGDGTVTTFVEVSYEQRMDVDFAWVIPIPEPIAADDVSSTSAELFNTLERATAPRFTFQWPEQVQVPISGGSYGYYDSRSGCACPNPVTSTKTDGVTYDTGTTITTEEVSVEVVAEAVVGPFAIEVITATDAVEFAEWLEANAYDLPEGAVTPLEHYVSAGMAFLGVKLAPDVPAGPIDTLEFTYPSTDPMIPIILTSIASTSELPILTYVLSDEPFAPVNYDALYGIAEATLPVGEGTDYLSRVSGAIDGFGGHAFVLELAQPTADLEPLGVLQYDELIAERAWLTRWRGELSPDQMTLDPVFSPSPALEPYSNDHLIVLDEDPTPGRRAAGGLGAGLALPLALAGWLGRRRR